MQDYIFQNLFTAFNIYFQNCSSIIIKLNRRISDIANFDKYELHTAHVKVHLGTSIYTRKTGSRTGNGGANQHCLYVDWPHSPFTLSNWHINAQNEFFIKKSNG